MIHLPEGYRVTETIDLTKNRREVVLVNLLAVVIAAGVTVLGFFLSPPFAGFQIRFGDIVAMLVFLLAVLAYILLHEAVHGVFMKAFSGVRPRYGFTGVFAYAGSDALFDKTQYLVIAFAPVVLLGGLLAVLTAAFYETAFWYIYIIQIINISGAAGDLYVSWRISRIPGRLLVRDTGVVMTVFSDR